MMMMRHSKDYVRDGIVLLRVFGWRRGVEIELSHQHRRTEMCVWSKESAKIDITIAKGGGGGDSLRGPTDDDEMGRFSQWREHSKCHIPLLCRSRSLYRELYALFLGWVGRCSVLRVKGGSRSKNRSLRALEMNMK